MQLQALISMVASNRIGCISFLFWDLMSQFYLEHQTLCVQAWKWIIGNFTLNRA